MKIKQLSSRDNVRWDTYVANHPRGKIYHTTGWMEVVEQTFHRRTYYYFVEEDDKVVGILPLVAFNSWITGNQLISLPYVNYGGLLTDNDDVSALLLDWATTLLRDNGFRAVELRYDWLEQLSLPAKSNKVTFILDLPDTTDQLMKSFKAKLRSQIRRPLKENMFSRVGSSELIDDFYFVFCRNMRDLGTPVYSKKFFQNIIALLPENAKIVCIYTPAGQPVASAFLLGFGDTMEIPWASSLRKFNRFSPNMLLYWEVLSEAIRSGYKKFDFGRGTRDGGTHRFKKQWGGREQQLNWYYILPGGQSLPQINKENPRFAMAIRVWQKLPLAITRWIGPSIVKELP